MQALANQVPGDNDVGIDATMRITDMRSGRSPDGPRRGGGFRRSGSDGHERREAQARRKPTRRPAGYDAPGLGSEGEDIDTLAGAKAWPAFNPETAEDVVVRRAAQKGNESSRSQVARVAGRDSEGPMENSGAVGPVGTVCVATGSGCDVLRGRGGSGVDGGMRWIGYVTRRKLRLSQDLQANGGPGECA